MERYTLYYRGQGSPAGDAALIAATPGVRVIDREVDRAMLVEAEPGTIDKVRAQFPQWLVSREVFYPRPEPQ